MDPLLSVVVVVRDAEELVADALDSVTDLADEIVVLDTGSVDGTVEVLRSRTDVRLLHCEFDGFGAVKQRALEACRGVWVLSLDADERVSPELATRVGAIVRADDPAAPTGYKIRRRNWILGRVMRTMGLQKDAPLRLFRRQGATFDPHLVHEGVALPDGATIGRIEEPIEHHTLTGIDQYLSKQDQYTSLDLAQNPREHSTLHLVTVWPTTFYRYYVARRGFRDGFPGLLWAGLAATGRFMRDMKVWIAHEQARRSRDDDRA